MIDMTDVINQRSRDNVRTLMSTMKSIHFSIFEHSKTLDAVRNESDAVYIKQHGHLVKNCRNRISFVYAIDFQWYRLLFSSTHSPSFSIFCGNLSDMHTSWVLIVRVTCHETLLRCAHRVHHISRCCFLFLKCTYDRMHSSVVFFTLLLV